MQEKKKKKKITHTNKIKFNFVRVGGTQAIQLYPDILYGYMVVLGRDTSCFEYINLPPHMKIDFEIRFHVKSRIHVFKTRCIFGIYPHVKRKTHVSET